LPSSSSSRGGSCRPTPPSAPTTSRFEVNFVPRANPSVYEDNPKNDGVINVSCADGAITDAMWGAVARDVACTTDEATMDAQQWGAGTWATLNNLGRPVAK